MAFKQYKLSQTHCHYGAYEYFTLSAEIQLRV